MLPLPLMLLLPESGNAAASRCQRAKTTTHGHASSPSPTTDAAAPEASAEVVAAGDCSPIRLADCIRTWRTRDARSAHGPVVSDGPGERPSAAADAAGTVAAGGSVDAADEIAMDGRRAMLKRSIYSEEEGRLGNDALVQLLPRETATGRCNSYAC